MNFRQLPENLTV